MKHLICMLLTASLFSVTACSYSETAEALLSQTGFQIQPLTADYIKEKELEPHTEGVIVTQTDTSKVAWESGLRDGMVILYLNHNQITSVKNFTEVLEGLKGEDFLLVRVRIPDYGKRHLIIRLK